MDYRKKAERLVNEISSLEREYVRNFQAVNAKQKRSLNNSAELEKCELIARRLEKLDPDLQLQIGATLPKMFANLISVSADIQKNPTPPRERFIRTAIRLLKEGKYKPSRST